MALQSLRDHRNLYYTLLLTCYTYYKYSDAMLKLKLS